MDSTRITEPTPYQTYVMTLIEVLQELLVLHEYEILLEFDSNSESEARATISTNLDYLWAKLTVFPVVEKDFNEQNYEDIVETILHELVHILTDPLYKVAYAGTNAYTEPFLDNIREQTTQRITRIILPTLPEDIFTP